MDRRSFVIGTGASAAALATQPVFAQEAFPTRPVTVINAFPPGGINDIATRPLATMMEPILKQPVIVETKAGAAGQVGAQVASAAKPDGYTILSHNNGISSYAEVDKLFGRPVKTSRADFIPLARIIADPVLFLVNDQQPYKTFKEFLDAVRAKPDSLVFSSGGLYGASHLPLAYLEKATGPIKVRHLPTNGGGPAITAALGNNAQLTTQSTSATLQHIKAGKLRRSRASAPRARRCCRMCRRSRSWATTSNTISGSAFSRRRGRLARSWPRSPLRSRRPPTPTRSRPR